MTAKIVKFPTIDKNKFKPKWSTDDAIRHLSRVCNAMVQKQKSYRSFFTFFTTKMHKHDLQNLEHSIRIVDAKYDLELKNNND